ncbi:hypothetical protein RhiirA4_460120 [Rhizophagus irregularis]|uniref:Uncharacterized protein n=1 Tax=Rhizophagus irregularis TaxID=588596 RepID=A0A2I1GFW9_9GLOM|nr:hypothetical protein RhiirA4_460120 [Rhizophagus irregularis]
MKEHAYYYLDEIVGEINRETDKEVSTSTLRRSLKYCGIARKKCNRSRARLRY